MKKILAFVLLLFLNGCTAEVEEKNSVSGTEQTEMMEEILPFSAAENACYANGMLYYPDRGFVRYVNLTTGEDRVLCYDPLCSHDDEDVTADCGCIAYHAEDGFTGRVLAEDGKTWFLAREPISLMPGNTGMYYQIRCIDLENMSLTVYLRENEKMIYDFWLYGDEIYLSMPMEETDDSGRVVYSGGSIYRMEKNGKLTLVLDDTEGNQFRLLAAGEGCIYYRTMFGGGEIYRAASDFSVPETAAVLNGVYNIRISGGYVYYMKKTGNSYSIDLEDIDGEFNNDLSRRELRGNEYGLYRMKLDGTAEETVYASMPQIKSNSVLDWCTYRVDEEKNLIWLVPLDPSCTGYGIWQPDLLMMQMGADGTDILTGIFSETGGRILALNADTLTVSEEYRIPGWDLIDLYAVENGRVMGLFRLTDAEKLKILHESEGLNSYWQYEEYRAAELD